MGEGIETVMFPSCIIPLQWKYVLNKNGNGPGGVRIARSRDLDNLSEHNKSVQFGENWVQYALNRLTHLQVHALTMRTTGNVIFAHAHNWPRIQCQPVALLWSMCSTELIRILYTCYAI
jgi:hypothetical protein